MQSDWAEYRVPIAETISRVHIHHCILGYNRYKVFDASLAVHQADAFTALEEAVIELKGCVSKWITPSCKALLEWSGLSGALLQIVPFCSDIRHRRVSSWQKHATGKTCAR